MKQTLGRKKLRPGPKPPKCGRTRVTVNFPTDLIPVVEAMTGKSLSDKIVGLVNRLSQPPKKATKK